MTEIIKSIKSRFFVFFQHQGYSAFGFFNALPERKEFGFETKVKEFNDNPSPENLLKYLKSAKNLKDVMVALIHSHNNALLEQYLIDEYELLLQKLLSA